MDHENFALKSGARSPVSQGKVHIQPSSIPRALALIFQVTVACSSKSQDIYIFSFNE